MSALELRFSGRHVLALLVALMLALLTTLHAANSDETLLRFAHLVRTDSWTEKWPEISGEVEEREVTAGIWNDAIQAALDQANSVHLPKRDQPYYLDGPIVLMFSNAEILRPIDFLAKTGPDGPNFHFDVDHLLLRSKSCVFAPALISTVSVEFLLYLAGTASTVSSTFVPGGMGDPTSIIFPVILELLISTRADPTAAPSPSAIEYFPLLMIPPAVGPFVPGAGTKEIVPLSIGWPSRRTAPLTAGRSIPDAPPQPFANMAILATETINESGRYKRQ